MRSKLEQELRQFISENFLVLQEKSVKNDESFLENGILDSTGVLELVSFLEEKYGIEIESGELIPENLDSISRITLFLERRFHCVKPVACAPDEGGRAQRGATHQIAAPSRGTEL